MKTKGRAKSTNIIDKRSFPMNGVDAFLAESLTMAYKNYKVPLPRKRPITPPIPKTRPRSGKK